MRFIWATRGYSWGFRFLRRGGLDDPLHEYEAAFATLEDQSEGWRRVGGQVAVRFPDPLGRCDAAGRVIPHDFVLLGALAHGIDSLEDARDRIWPVVAEEYTLIWRSATPPPARD